MDIMDFNHISWNFIWWNYDQYPRIRLSLQHEDALHRAPLEGAGSRRDAKFWCEKNAANTLRNSPSWRCCLYPQMLGWCFPPRKDGFFGMSWMYIKKILLLLRFYIMSLSFDIILWYIVLDTILQYYVRVLYIYILCYYIYICIYLYIYIYT